MSKQNPLSVVIVGCGLGGLACAIQCRREGLNVLVLERTAELSEVGAGIQLPPNAARIMSEYGLMEKLSAAGMIPFAKNYLLRWEDGSTIGMRPGDDYNIGKYGFDWYGLHRADYQRVLVEEARRLGAEIRLGCDVLRVECNDIAPSLELTGGEVVTADVIIGADGIRSPTRSCVLGYRKEPEESGDLAYRITIPRESLVDETDPLIQDILRQEVNCMWWGEKAHVVLYGVRNTSLINVVLICPDDLPREVSRQPSDHAEMLKLFEKWDPRISILLSKVNTALKWKIWGMEELDTWTKGSVALLGDACHPTVPYAAQGAAMAVEDAAVLGRLLGLYSRAEKPTSCLPDVLKLYQDVRKQRTVTIVAAANAAREIYHLEDGEAQQERDRLLKEHDWWDDKASSNWAFADSKVSNEMFAFDALSNAEEAWRRHWITASGF